MLREITTKQWIKNDPDVETTQHNFSTIVDDHCVIACSGGADSVALALLSYCNEIPFTLAYVEHEISDATAHCAVFVKQLADDLGVEFCSEQLHMSALGLDQSNVEATARELRYSALERVRINTKSRYILTAHHSDDVAETFLINVMRGSGSGTASLAQQRGHIVRPLLHWRKSQLETFVTSSGFEFFTDPSNTDARYVRNRVRNELIGLMDDISSRDVVPLLVRAAELTRSDQQYLDELATFAWPQGNADTNELAKLHPVIQTHALRAWVEGTPPSYDEMQRILDVVHHKIRSTQISGNRTIWRRGACLYQDVTSTFSQEKE